MGKPIKMRVRVRGEDKEGENEIARKSMGEQCTIEKLL